jgi:hypothetical protein
VRTTAARAGLKGDPFPLVKRQDPGWTRERWDRAVAELEGLVGRQGEPRGFAAGAPPGIR